MRDAGDGSYWVGDADRAVVYQLTPAGRVARAHPLVDVGVASPRSACPAQRRARYRAASPCSTPEHIVVGVGEPSLMLVSFDEQNRFDASDRDGPRDAAALAGAGRLHAGWNRGLRRDGVDSFITANEGDTRGYDVKRLADVELDPERFPDATRLQSAQALGRPKVSVLDGDLDADGDHEIHASCST